MKLSLKLRQTGDTIIEVLICLTIITAVMATSLVTASGHANTVRRSQERGEALFLVQGQIEFLRSYVVSPTFVYPTGGFCLANTAGTITKVPVTVAYNDPGYPADCAVGDDSRYKIDITPSVPPDAPGKYVIRAQWDGVGNVSLQNVSISYKVYP